MNNKDTDKTVSAPETRSAVKSYQCHMDENHTRTLYDDGSTSCESKRALAGQNCEKYFNNSPWGKPDSCVKLRVGPKEFDEIIRVDTPSHGGYFVPAHLVNQIPLDQQRWAAKWSGSRYWYEEDCCWAAVALAFPSQFDDNTRVAAQDIVNTYCIA